MKNRALNTLNYTGIVTLSQYVGRKKIKIAQMHNTGGTSLFSFLANCLAGDFTAAKAHVPTKIKLLSRKGDATDGYYTYTPLTQYTALRTPPEPSADAGESRVRFSFIIPRDFIDSLSGLNAADETVGLGLFANSVPDKESEAGNFMAFCELANIDKNSLVNTFLVVDWDLIISNTGTNNPT